MRLIAAFTVSITPLSSDSSGFTLVGIVKYPREVELVWLLTVFFYRIRLTIFF